MFRSASALSWLSSATKTTRSAVLDGRNTARDSYARGIDARNPLHPSAKCCLTAANSAGLAPKTRNGRRLVDVPDALGAIFDAIKAERRPLILKRRWSKDAPWMFCTGNGTPFAGPTSRGTSAAPSAWRPPRSVRPNRGAGRLLGDTVGDKT